MNCSGLFELLPNQAAVREQTYTYVDGGHPWKLPSIRCSACGMVWGERGLSYPQIDLSGLKPQKWYKGNLICVMSPEELSVARAPVAAMLPPGYPLPPGTALGPFRGRHLAGTMEDFDFYSGAHLISRSAFDLLHTAGALGVEATPAQVNPRRTGTEIDLLELHLVPRARLAVPRTQDQGQRFCVECGFDQREFPSPLVIARSSIPDKEEIFQLCEGPDYILCTKKFVDGVESLGLRGIEFRPVDSYDV